MNKGNFMLLKSDGMDRKTNKAGKIKYNWRTINLYQITGKCMSFTMSLNGE